MSKNLIYLKTRLMTIFTILRFGVFGGCWQELVNINVSDKCSCVITIDKAKMNCLKFIRD